MGCAANNKGAAIFGQTASGNRKVADNIFIDLRDGQEYRTVKIGNLIWMAENLKYTSEELTDYTSRTHYSKINALAGSRIDNLEKYGRLYTWAAAKDAVPPGWRLPTRDEWDDLARAAGGTRQLDDKGFIDWEGAGIKLKAKTGWERGFNGTDVLMFTAKPGGSNGAFGDWFPEDAGYWWTATESKDDRAYSRTLSAIGDDMYETDFSKRWLLSVRAVSSAPVKSGPPLSQDKSALALIAFKVNKNAVSENETVTINWQLKNMMNSGRTHDFFAAFELVDSSGKRVAHYGAGDVESFPAGKESYFREGEWKIDKWAAPPGQYQLRLYVEYWANHVKQEKTITLSSPGVPTSIPFTVKGEAAAIAEAPQTTRTADSPITITGLNKFNSFLGDVIITSSTDRDSEGTTFAMSAGVEIKDGGLTVNLRDYS